MARPLCPRTALCSSPVECYSFLCPSSGFSGFCGAFSGTGTSFRGLKKLRNCLPCSRTTSWREGQVRGNDVGERREQTH